MRFLPRPRKWKYYLMRVVVSTIGRLPLGWRYGISRVVSDRIYDWRRSIRRNVQSNVRHVLGPDATDEEVDRIARQCTRNAGRYYADVVGMHRMNVRKFLRDDLVLTGLDYVREAQASGRGIVLASAHYANPEFAVQGLAAAGIKVLALVEPLDPPQLGRLMRTLRAVHGHEYEPVSLGAVKRALAWLKSGGVVAILIDRDIQKHGTELMLCGARAKFPTGAVDLAMRTNSVMMPGWVRRTGGFKIEAKIGPPLALIETGCREDDLRVNSQRLLDLFEEHLRRDPGQWGVLDRIWPDDLAPAPTLAETSTEEKPEATP